MFHSARCVATRVSASDQTCHRLLSPGRKTQGNSWGLWRTKNRRACGCCKAGMRRGEPWGEGDFGLVELRNRCSTTELHWQCGVANLNHEGNPVPRQHLNFYHTDWPMQVTAWIRHLGGRRLRFNDRWRTMHGRDHGKALGLARSPGISANGAGSKRADQSHRACLGIKGKSCGQLVFKCFYGKWLSA